MADIWRPQPIEVYKSWVDAIIDEASDDLTEWEAEFVSSLNQRLEKGSNLTERQAATLEAIYTAKTN